VCGGGPLTAVAHRVVRATLGAAAEPQPSAVVPCTEVSQRGKHCAAAMVVVAGEHVASVHSIDSIDSLHMHACLHEVMPEVMHEVLPEVTAIA
jgi:hypothetical protein